MLVAYRQWVGACRRTTGEIQIDIDIDIDIIIMRPSPWRLHCGSVGVGVCRAGSWRIVAVDGVVIDC